MGKMKLIEAHEYVSIDFGNGRRLTTSYSGEKATGAVPRKVFTAWCALFEPGATGTVIERVKKFMAEAPTLWPEWAAPPPSFAPGDEVTMDPGKRGVMRGTIVKKARTSYVVRFPNELASVPADMLRAAGAA